MKERKPINTRSCILIANPPSLDDLVNNIVNVFCVSCALKYLARSLNCFKKKCFSFSPKQFFNITPNDGETEIENIESKVRLKLPRGSREKKTTVIFYCPSLRVVVHFNFDLMRKLEWKFNYTSSNYLKLFLSRWF